MRLSIRWLLVLIALAAGLLAPAAWVYREFRRVFPSSPAVWARLEARESSNPRRYLELARGFERRGDIWAEATYHGPFTDVMPDGQEIIVAQATEGWPSDRDGRRLDGTSSWVVPEGRRGVIVRDGAVDSDGCYDWRRMLVSFSDGPLRNKLTTVERIDLRRWVGREAAR